MKLLKFLPATLAAASLSFAQPALALANHAPDVPVDELGAPKASEPLVFLLLVVAGAIIIGLLFEDDSSSFPTSP